MTVEEICAISLGLDPVIVNINSASQGIFEIDRKINQRKALLRRGETEDELTLCDSLMEFLSRVHTIRRNTKKYRGMIEAFEIEEKDHIDFLQFIEFSKRMEWKLSDQIKEIDKELQKIDPTYKVSTDEKPNHLRIVGLLAWYIWAKKLKGSDPLEKPIIDQIATELSDFPKTDAMENLIQSHGFSKSALNEAFKEGIKKIRI